MVLFRTAGFAVGCLLLIYAVGLSASGSSPDVGEPFGTAAEKTASPPWSVLPGAFLRFDGDLLASHAAALSDQVLNHPATDPQVRRQDNAAAQSALTKALGISPLRPAVWLTLGMLKARIGEPAAPALKLSYLSGAVPPDLAYARIELVTSTSAASDEEIALLAESDLRVLLSKHPRYEAALIAAYIQATEEGRRLLLDGTRLIDPKFSAALQER